jgi:hypothetical protein
VNQRFCWGFGKTLPFEYGFDGAISTLARQGGGSIRDHHLSFILWIDFSLEEAVRICSRPCGFGAGRRGFVKVRGT